MGTPFPEQVTGQGGALIVNNIHSPNFVHGSAGWSIDQNGNAEFNSIILPPGTSVTITFAATAPASPNDGDLWYNTSAGNEVSQWNGSAWVPYQIGTGAIVPGSITASLIAANTITASQLAAGIIYAGIINGTTVSAATFTGSVFEGTDFIINSSGAFFYNGTPAAGNLIASIAPAAGNDSFNNRYQGGVTAYCLDGGVYYAINLNNFALGAPNITFAQSSAYSGPYTTQATIGQDASASLSVDASTVNLGASAVGVGGPGVNINPVNSVNGLSAGGADWSLLLTLGQMSLIANTGTGYSTSGVGTISGTPTAAEFNALNTAANNAIGGLNQVTGKFNSLLAELQNSNYMT